MDLNYSLSGEADGYFGTETQKVVKQFQQENDMEITGIRIDTNLFLELNTKTSQLIAEIKKEIYNYAGEEFNIDSPKQLSSILFDKLQLPTYNNKKNNIYNWRRRMGIRYRIWRNRPCTVYK